ncbi:Lrp/AsnC family transcriptional regulator [Streptomyces sp. OR43]|uniref:Lrp/AsnC family transcriptional regulator n=1 Tax=Streptomyces sp. or43 TaxID=2478957 RepID=UPI0021C9CA72|nr:Lrp/AsnC family transcriptional regulator [Streptomyces sp. or43]
MGRPYPLPSRPGRSARRRSGPAARHRLRGHRLGRLGDHLRHPLTAPRPARGHAAPAAAPVHGRPRRQHRSAHPSLRRPSHGRLDGLRRASHRRAGTAAGGQPVPGPGRPAPSPHRGGRLLDALAEDGRTSHTQLAEATGWSKGRVARRLEALETSGTLAYDIDLLPEHLGFALNATLWLRVAPARLERAGDEIAGHDEVAFAAATSGDHNVMAIVICRDAEEFYRYLTTRLAATPGVDAYGVSIRVRRLKQAASLISHGRLVPPAPV